MTEETYEVRLQCSNCGSSGIHKILKGVDIDRYVKFEECQNCGCKLLGKDLTTRVLDFSYNPKNY